jgi:predicted dehydrogenase
MTTYHFHIPIQVRYMDLDPQWHVNNAKFLSFLETARMQYLLHLGLWDGKDFFRLGLIVASVHLDYLQQPPTHTLEIVGSAGTLRWNNADGVLSVYHPNAQDWSVEKPPQGFDRNWLFLDELRNFIALARGDAQPACTLDDGVRALEIALCARESAQDGQRKVLGSA